MLCQRRQRGSAGSAQGVEPSKLTTSSLRSVDAAGRLVVLKNKMALTTPGRLEDREPKMAE